MTHFLRGIMPDAMQELFWFGITYSFTCPKCKKLSTEKAVISSPTDNRQQIEEVINREKLRCKLCSALPSQGHQIAVHVQPGTLEELKSRGYPVPRYN
jgi:hypothetical protein